jgi:hypothetical protein
VCPPGEGGINKTCGAVSLSATACLPETQYRKYASGNEIQGSGCFAK